MSRVVLSLGSNLGDRLARLQGAVDALGARVQCCSPVYETAPWGGVEQDAFLNAVVLAEDPDLDGLGWLRLAQQIEQDAERVRTQKWGPRTLDVDLVAVTDEDGPVESGTAELTLPHPLAHQRAFVLIPWLDVDPTAQLGVAGRLRPAAELLAALHDDERSGVQLTSWELHGPDART